MKDRPIDFSEESVRAALDGRMTQVRRAIKFPDHTYTPDAAWVKSIHPDGGGNWVAWSTNEPGLAEFTKRAYPNGEGFPCPYGRPGDRLWVREIWRRSIHKGLVHEAECPGYRATRLFRCGSEIPSDRDLPWNPSITMPRWASRILLEIVDIRAEQLQDIDERGLVAQGIATRIGDLSSCVEREVYRFALSEFCEMWNAANAKRCFTWESNPWVWVIEFRVLLPADGETR